MTELILPGHRPPTGHCRVCKKDLYGPEHSVARHMQRCGQQHFEATFEQRSGIARLLEEQDPEWGDYVRSGRHKPSTEPV